MSWVKSSSDPDNNVFEGSQYNTKVVVGSLIIGVFFGGIGAGVAFPTLPTLGTILGISPFVVGVILSSNRFTRLVMNTPAGQIIDKLGTRKPMLIGFVFQAITPFGYVLGLYPGYVPVAGAAEIFFIARAQWGIGSAFVFVGAFSMITKITTQQNRGKWLGYFRGGQTLGVPAGMVVGGILTDLYGYAVAFLSSGVVALVAVIVAVAVLPDIRPSVDQTAGIRDIPRIVQADPRILAIGSVNFVVRFLFAGVLLVTVVLYAEANEIRIGEFSAVGASGLIMAISLLFSSVTTLISGNLSDRMSNRAMITLPALGCLGFGFALLGILPTLVGTLVGVAAIGIGAGGTNPPLLAYLGDISHEADTGKMGGVYNIFGDLGATIGPLIALPVAAQIGYRAEYLACVGLVVLVTLVVLRVLIGTSTNADPVNKTASDN